MSNRLTLVNAISSAGFADVNQLFELIPLWHPEKIKATIKDCIKAELIVRTMDNGELCYTVTAKGSRWLKDQTGGYITAPARPETIADIVVPPKPDYDPDAVCFDAQKREAAKDAEIAELKAKIAWMDEIQAMTKSELNERDKMIGRIGVQLINVTADAEGHNIEHKVAQVCHDLIHAESERNAWREMAGIYNHKTPIATPADLAGFIGEKIHAAESAETALAMTIAGESAQESQELTGFIVALLDDDTPVFAAKEDARIAAIANAAATGLRASVLHLIDTAESVKVEWASDSKKTIES